MRPTYLFSTLIWFLFVSPSTAQESFVLTGASSANLPATITLVNGSELTPCRNGATALMRCVLLDAAHANAIMIEFSHQLQTQGFVRMELPPGALSEIVAHAPAQPATLCPDVVMFMPGSEDRDAAGPVPEDRVFVTFSYFVDACMLQPRER